METGRVRRNIGEKGGIAKDYLQERGLKILNNLVSGYFDFAKVQTIQRCPRYMTDYVEQLDNILHAAGEEVLTHAGRISHAQAIEKPGQSINAIKHKRFPLWKKENFMKSSNRDDGWLTGRLYSNREDKRVIIKRPRSGFGYTMNLGNKWTWIFNIIFVIIIVILVSVF